MEKSVSVAVTNENVWNFLPYELVLFILSKLPLKSLKRFQCVCKSWSLLFKNPHFMNMFIDNAVRDNNSCHDDDTFLILKKKLVPPITYGDRWHMEFYWVSNDKFENWVKLDWPSQFQNDDINIYVVGSVSINGILCLRQEFTDSCRVVLWNPTTSEAKLIPPSPNENIPPDRSPWSFLHGFCYDRVNDDYKVIQMTDFDPDEDADDDGYEDRSYDPLWEIYSLRSNSWKKLDFDMRNCYLYWELRSIGMYTDGMFHWWADSDSKNVRPCLLSFDFSSETLLNTPMPSDIDVRLKSRNLVRNLAWLNGSITLITTYAVKNHPDAGRFCISILGKLGVEESWINLIIVGCLPFAEFPIGVGKSSDVIFFKRYARELVWVDLRTEMIGEIAINGKKLGGCQMGKYKKSFDPIG